MTTLAFTLTSVIATGDQGSVILAADGILPFWEFECVGSGQPVITAAVEAFNLPTGEVVWTVTDKDGIKGSASAVISGNKITMFGSTGEVTPDRSMFVIKNGDCPRGFVGTGFN